MPLSDVIVHVSLTLAIGCAAPEAFAQEPSVHQHAEAPESTASWMWMQDGAVFMLFNHQGGPRGGDEFRAPNWWMGMGTRKAGRSLLTLTSMLSLDPATVGTRGYGEIFQVGESVDGQPLVDRQHPHDAFMQVGAAWRFAATDRTGLTLAGGPSAEPALGPVAFMHRATSADNPLAPLGHHAFDSTHIAFGVITAALDHGPFVVEGSVFNGREPDQHRWDFDFGPLDSVSARLWYTPSAEWEMQVSTGHLREPEALEPGDVQRTTASVGWTHQAGTALTALFAGYGVNDTSHGARHALLLEATRRRDATSLFGRFELLQPDTGALLGTDGHDDPAPVATLGAVTVGALRTLHEWRGFDGSVGAEATFYAVPDVLAPTHGKHPVSFQIYFRVRPPAPMGRMVNMRFAQPPRR